MPRTTEKSEAAFDRARKVLVGGVNSPVRAFAAVGGTPPFIAKASGVHLSDVDGNEYIDYMGSWGPAILGHAPEHVVTAINKQVHRGTSFGAPTDLETRLAEAIVAAIDGVDKVRFVSSGTEAAMTAVRLARGATGRNKIIKCIGCYHGHMDALLVSAGSGAATLGIPSSPGVPAGTVNDTILVAYNDPDAVAQVLQEYDGQVAAMLLEPVAGNMGVIPPAEGYLERLRALCDQSGTLLVFDEVMTGFRVHYGGAQTLYGVRPDLTILGKVIGGGLPVGAVAGPGEILSQLAPEGPIYQAGTLSGNPAAMAAGLATLQDLQIKGLYEQLEDASRLLEQGLKDAARQAGLEKKVCFNRVGSMLCCFFTPGPVTDFAAVSAADTEAFAAWFGSMLKQGIYLPPSQFETLFVSAVHEESDIEQTVQAARNAFQAARRFMKSGPAER
jgi:glutamate-1-semialdehyde 2,1-aminomutase